MKLHQLSIFVENKPGALSAPCKLLAEHKINLETLSLADTKYFGVLRLLVKDWEKAKCLLESNGFTVKVTEVVAVEVDHLSGNLSQVLQVLDESALNVEYMYAFPAVKEKGKAALIFRFDEPDTAIEKLVANNKISILNHTDLF
jgi:hypothetical protein